MGENSLLHFAGSWRNHLEKQVKKKKNKNRLKQLQEVRKMTTYDVVNGAFGGAVSEDK